LSRIQRPNVDQNGAVVDDPEGKRCGPIVVVVSVAEAEAFGDGWQRRSTATAKAPGIFRSEQQEPSPSVIVVASTFPKPWPAAANSAGTRRFVVLPKR
jgi:hypothetical protein